MQFELIRNLYYPGYSLAIYVTSDVSSLASQAANDFYKIIYTESGTLRYELNGSEYFLTGAAALCLHEEDQVTLFTLHEQPITILYFKPSVINSKFDYVSINDSHALSIPERQDLFYLSQFKHIAQTHAKVVGLAAMDSSVLKRKLSLLFNQLSLQDNCSWPCRSRSYLFEILFMLSRPQEETDSFLPTQIDSHFSKLSIDVIHYLQTCYDQKVTLEKIAQIFHTNRTTLLTDFKKSTGQSINRYVTQLRMTMAASLLRDTQLSINEICERTGYSDFGYFSRSFKKETQYTPSEYRSINTP
jgi:AraC-like DNA-binding protein